MVKINSNKEKMVPKVYEVDQNDGGNKNERHLVIQIHPFLNKLKIKILIT